MQWIMKRYKYKIGDATGKNKRAYNIMDFILCLIYAGISLFNALVGINSLTIFGKSDTVGSGGITKTMFLLIINIIVLLRLNLNLNMKENEAKENEIGKINNSSGDIVEINIHMFKKRLSVIHGAYIADFIIILMNIVFKSTVEVSLSWVVMITIAVTFWNNIIDIVANAYKARPIITYEYEKAIEGR